MFGELVTLEKKPKMNVDSFVVCKFECKESVVTRVCYVGDRNTQKVRSDLVYLFQIDA